MRFSFGHIWAKDKSLKGRVEGQSMLLKSQVKVSPAQVQDPAGVFDRVLDSLAPFLGTGCASLAAMVGSIHRPPSQGMTGETNEEMMKEADGRQKTRGHTNA